MSLTIFHSNENFKLPLLCINSYSIIEIYIYRIEKYEKYINRNYNTVMLVLGGFKVEQKNSRKNLH